MTRIDEPATHREDRAEPLPDHSPPFDADQSGALAIGLMIAVVTLVALMTLALIVSIP